MRTRARLIDTGRPGESLLARRRPLAGATEQPDLGATLGPAPDCHRRAERRISRASTPLDHKPRCVARGGRPMICRPCDHRERPSSPWVVDLSGSASRLGERACRGPRGGTPPGTARCRRRSGRRGQPAGAGTPVAFSGAADVGRRDGGKGHQFHGVDLDLYRTDPVPASRPHLGPAPEPERHGDVARHHRVPQIPVELHPAMLCLRSPVRPAAHRSRHSVPGLLRGVASVPCIPVNFGAEYRNIMTPVAGARSAA
jgi:hypothetical protein